MTELHNSDSETEEDKSARLQISNIIQHYTVGLIKRPERDTSYHIGCGTLVSFQDHFGIITANHVVEELTGIFQLGLVISDKASTFHIDQSCLLINPLGKRTSEEFGPDLAFIELAKPDINTIKATFGFHNLDLDLSFYKGWLVDDFGWVVCGTPNIQTLEFKNEDGFSLVKALSNYCLFVNKPTEHHENGYDYLDFKIDPQKGSIVPSSLDGMSGGGVWKIEWDNNTKIFTYRYWGVIFYQSSPVNGIRNLRCHGCRSVYEKLIPMATGQMG
jgi:hypothetical protein